MGVWETKYRRRDNDRVNTSAGLQEFKKGDSQRFIRCGVVSFMKLLLTALLFL